MEAYIIVEKPGETKPRNAFIAFIFSLLFPGLGQFYNGQVKKAIIFITLIFISPFLFGFMKFGTNFYGLLTCFFVDIFLRIFIIIDSIRVAKQQKEYVPKKYNEWYFYTLYCILIISVFYIFPLTFSLGVKTFSIPTSSNHPTVLIGDYVVVDLKAYENKTPNYGDIIAFKKQDGEFYLSRIVGLPGDHIEMINNIVSINGKLCLSKFIGERKWEECPQDLEIKEREYEEIFPNGHKHKIYQFSPVMDSTRINTDNIVVPANNYFLVSDNRDNSIDSRDFGFLNRQGIEGQLIYSYWRKTGNKINVDFRDK